MDDARVYGMTETMLREQPTVFRDGLFRGRRVLVTGGGRGLGKAIATLCARLGADIAICGRNAERLDATGSAEDGARGVRAFLVPIDAAGITRTRFNDVGSRIVGRGSIFFDDVRAPETARLGAEGAGFRQVMQGFDYSRTLIGLQCCAAAQASLDETWRYVGTREAFGVTLNQHQGVSFPLAEAETRIEAARRLCYHALALRDAGRPHTTEAAMGRFLAPKAAVEVIHQCLLLHGHYGWSMDLPHQQRLRDVMGLEIGDGTAQIMNMLMARDRPAARR